MLGKGDRIDVVKNEYNTMNCYSEEEKNELLLSVNISELQKTTLSEGSQAKRMHSVLRFSDVERNAIV